MKTSIAVSILIAALLSVVQPMSAQTPEAAARRSAIESFYPVMIQANNAGNYAKARSLCQKAIEWEPQNWLHYYNLACIEAKAGDPDAAFAALTQANLKGFADTEGLNSDSDLASLRMDARFKNIMFQTAQNAINQKGAQANTTPTQTPGPTAPAAAMPKFDPNRRLTPAAPAGNHAPSLSSGTGQATAPAPANLSDSGPVGLYFMTRSWIATGSLERAIWYFSPDGMAYENPTGDFSAASLSATASDQGQFHLEGKNLVFTRTKGKNTGKQDSSEYDPQPEGGFYWNTGSFIPVKALTSARSIVGKWQGGFSVIGAAVARTLDLHADGSFNLSGGATISAESDGSVVRAGSSGQVSQGTWEVSGYFMTLTGSNGNIRRSVAFPFGDSANPGIPDKFYFDGIMWSPLK
ncbi:MAG: tetratricopeptide repeat protein [Verrucomicrobiales bacterium]|nr:tetratricopeptide repeat protein [Verrucomicrobiales bacterium]